MKTSIPWVRIGIEGVVIVFSVLVALSADAWWDARQEEGRLRVGLEALLEDTQENTRRVQQTLERTKAQMDAAVELGDRLGGSISEADRAEVAALLAGALAIADLTQVTQAYDQIVAAGELGRLPSAVRTELATWMQRLIRYRDYVEAQGIQRRLLQYESYYIDQIGLREVLASVRPDLPLGRLRFPVDLRGLAADRRLDSLLAYRIILAANQLSELELSLEALGHLEQEVQRGLEELR